MHMHITTQFTFNIYTPFWSTYTITIIWWHRGWIFLYMYKDKNKALHCTIHWIQFSSAIKAEGIVQDNCDMDQNRFDQLSLKCVDEQWQLQLIVISASWLARPNVLIMPTMFVACQKHTIKFVLIAMWASYLYQPMQIRQHMYCTSNCGKHKQTLLNEA